MKKLEEYATPETDKLHDEFIADDTMPHLFAYQRAVEKSEDLERKLAMCRDALRELMPFVLETYYPECATPVFKSAVENAQKALKATEPK